MDSSDDDFVIDVDDISCEDIDPVAAPISSIAILLVLLPMLGFVFFRSRFVKS